jgi:hypothetical protein
MLQSIRSVSIFSHINIRFRNGYFRQRHFHILFLLDIFVGEVNYIYTMDTHSFRVPDELIGKFSISIASTSVTSRPLAKCVNVPGSIRHGFLAGHIYLMKSCLKCDFSFLSFCILRTHYFSVRMCQATAVSKHSDMN